MSATANLLDLWHWMDHARSLDIRSLQKMRAVRQAKVK